MKAVIFDLGLTLTKTASCPEIYRNILARFGIKATPDEFIRAQNATQREFETIAYDKIKRKEFWTKFNVYLLKKLGIQEDTVFLATQIDELWWKCSQIQIYPDVKPTLSHLRAEGLKLGLVSNGFKQDLDHVLEEMELERYFDVIVCIDSCNCAKPDMEIFLYALKQLGAKPGEAIFIGDSVVHDYEGALNVGIKPLLIDRQGKISGRYDTISSLTQLVIMVQGLLAANKY